MIGDRLEVWLAEASGEPTDDGACADRTLVDLVDKALALGGIDGAELPVTDESDESPIENAKKRAAAAVGVGAAALMAAQSKDLLAVAIERGGDIGDFVWANRDLLFGLDGPAAAAPEIADFLQEFVLRLPTGSLSLGRDIVEFIGDTDRLLAAANLVVDVDMSWLEALELAEVVATGWEIGSEIATFGLGLVIGAAGKRAVERRYEPQLDRARAALDRATERAVAVATLRHLVGSPVPTEIIAAQLDRVDEHHWVLTS